LAFRLRTTGCCGMLEMEDISRKGTPAEVIDGMLEAIQENTNDFSTKRPFITFTTVVDRYTGDHASWRRDDYGQALADYIEAEGLGEVFRDCPVRNNYTGNAIKIWIWMPDYRALEARFDAMPKPEPVAEPPVLNMAQVIEAMNQVNRERMNAPDYWGDAELLNRLDRA
jgi:hypothetical protein